MRRRFDPRHDADPAYRVRGHLDGQSRSAGPVACVEVPEDLDARMATASPDRIWPRDLCRRRARLRMATVREIIDALRETYCGHRRRVHAHQDTGRTPLDPGQVRGHRRTTQFTERRQEGDPRRLIAAEGFEKFLGKKYVGTKRFGLDGGESMIPALEQIIKRGGRWASRDRARHGPPRPPERARQRHGQAVTRRSSTSSRAAVANPEDVGGSGDVKYHLGTSPTASSTASACTCR